MADKQEIETSLHLFRVLSRAYRSVAEYSAEDVKQHGIQPTEFSVLELLYSKGPQPLQKIGSRILRTSGSVTYVIDKLEKKGLLVRQPDFKDRRVTLAVLTEDGRNLMNHIFPMHARAINDSLAGLDLSEKEQIIQLLRKMGFEAENRLKQLRRKD